MNGFVEVLIAFFSRPHPNLIRSTSICVTKNKVEYSMLKGESASRYYRMRLRLADLKSIFHDIGRALFHMHNVWRWTHNDVYGNILFYENEVLSDFSNSRPILASHSEAQVRKLFFQDFDQLFGVVQLFFFGDKNPRGTIECEALKKFVEESDRCQEDKDWFLCIIDLFIC